MRASVVIPVFLGAGALAHPHFKLNNPLAHVHHKRDQPAHIKTITVGNQVEVEEFWVHTVFGSPPPSSTTPPPAPTSSVVVVAAPQMLAVAPVVNNANVNMNNVNGILNDNKPTSSTPASVTPASVTPVLIAPSVTPASVTPVSSPPAAVPSSSSNDGAPKSGGVSILDTANKYRAMFGYPAFSYSSTLAANAAKTNADNGANSMTHELNPGSNAQCIAQADNLSGTSSLTSFELTYLAWLCEIPESKIAGVCQEMIDATHMKMDYADPGHAKILRNADYTQIGCNYLTSTQHADNYAGMWTCDFKL